MTRKEDNRFDVCLFSVEEKHEATNDDVRDTLITSVYVKKKIQLDRTLQVGKYLDLFSSPSFSLSLMTSAQLYILRC